VDFEGLQYMVIIVLNRKYDVAIFEPRIAAIGWRYDETQVVRGRLQGDESAAPEA
jgi:hypothetical protein